MAVFVGPALALYTVPLARQREIGPLVLLNSAGPTAFCTSSYFVLKILQKMGANFERDSSIIPIIVCT